MPPLIYRKRIARTDKKFAFATFLMLNENFLPGALLLAYALRKQNTGADIVCLVTEDISQEGIVALEAVFDYVVPVPTIFVSHKRRQERQDRPYLFTRFNVLRLGADGDLGFRYEKIVLLDSDVLPLRNYADLFALDAPAGIPNETKSLVYDPDAKERGTITKWAWHERYEPVCPHGSPIPKEITDRVLTDFNNMGVNTSLLVIKPSFEEFEQIMEDIQRPDVQSLVGDKFSWPEMQYITQWWSGRWTSVDIQYCGFYGFPSLAVLKGTHYAGVKPWQFNKNASTIKRYSRFEDYQYWFREYRSMLRSFPGLQKMKRLMRLLQEIMLLESK